MQHSGKSLLEEKKKNLRFKTGDLVRWTGVDGDNINDYLPKDTILLTLELVIWYDTCHNRFYDFKTCKIHALSENYLEKVEQ